MSRECGRESDCNVSNGVNMEGRCNEFKFKKTAGRATSSCGTCRNKDLLFAGRNVAVNRRVGRSSIVLATPKTDGADIAAEANIGAGDGKGTVISKLSPCGRGVMSLGPLRLPSGIRVTRASVGMMPATNTVIRNHFGAGVNDGKFLCLEADSGGPIPFNSMMSIGGDGAATNVINRSNRMFLDKLPSSNILRIG